MSMEKSDVLDFLKVHESGQIVLTIADELGWSDEQAHIDALQRKLERYLDAMESGEVHERASEAAGREIPRDAPLQIEIVAPFPWPSSTDAFLSYLKGVVAGAGFELIFRVLRTQSVPPD